MSRDTIKLVAVGSVALDTISTQAKSRTNLLGGSASYACASASLFANVGMVGVVGSDFPERFIKTFQSLSINLDGLQHKEGKTFRWTGRYESDMNTRQTLSTELNVFSGFSPVLPASYQRAPFLFLANIAPDLQLRVLNQIQSVKFIAADTMDLWIETKKPALMKVIRRVDLLLINDSEVRKLTRQENLVKAGQKILSYGPRFLIIKKGEHGSMLISKDDVFILPAYPVDEVADPTGAGDAFAGGLIGYLARSASISLASLRMAMLYGTVLASFAVETFSLDRLAGLKSHHIDKRVHELKNMTSL